MTATIRQIAIGRWTLSVYHTEGERLDCFGYGVAGTGYRTKASCGYMTAEAADADGRRRIAELEAIISRRVRS
jgi:hypothetical protein